MIPDLRAQVTIGSGIAPAKAALLDIKQQDDKGGGETATGGVKMPRVMLTDQINLYPMFTGLEDDYDDQKLIHKGLVVYNINTNTPFSEGLYSWNGTTWNILSGRSTTGDPTKDSWLDDLTNNMVKLDTQSDGVTARLSGSEFVIKDNGSVGIGTSSPNASAILELASTNKAVLGPRVTLTSYNDIATVPDPVVGMFVYNTGTGNLKYNGYVYWNGTEWRSFDNTTIANPSLSAISCSDAYLAPISYTAGTAYSGSLNVPYTDGNGGAYSGGTTTTVNGLTFKLLPGTLAYGSGLLVFSVTGTPTVSSPTTSNININSTLIPFYTGSSCTTSKVGLSETKSGEFVSTSFDINASTPTNIICFDGGRLCIRYNGTGSNSPLEIRHTYGNAQVLLAYSFWGTGALISPSGTLSQKNTNLANNAWTTLYDYGPALNTEGQITQFSLVDKVTNEVKSYQVIGDMIIGSEIGSGKPNKMFLKITKN